MILSCVGLVVASAPAHAGQIGSSGWQWPLGSSPTVVSGGEFLGNGCGPGGNSALGGYGFYDNNIFHIGVDMSAGVNADVVAIGPGTVKGTWGNFGGDGGAVFIEHTATDGSTFVALYGHVKNYITSGTVQAGSFVGDVNSDHTHFGIHPGSYGSFPNGNWGTLSCATYWTSGSAPTSTNGFVDPIPYLGAHPVGSGSSSSSGVGTRILGDVNGDGKDDAVVMFRDTGTAMVALSTGSGFATPTSWSYLHTVGADRYFLADVNGDDMADLVAFWVSNGRWRVSLSSGLGFWPETEWAYGQGTSTAKQWVVDVDGDPLHKADMVTFDSTTGDWYVSTSTGTGFGPIQQQWADGHGYGSNDQVVADFSGDGRADSGVYFTSTGAWHVANSLGTTFGGAPPWSSGHGMNSNLRHVGDVNGDNMADAAYFFSSIGHWDIGASSGLGFWPPTAWADGQGKGTTEQFLAKVNSDNMADMVTFDRSTGDWYVSASSGSGFWPPVLWISGHGKNS